MEQVYLDYAATSPTHPQVIKAMQPYYFALFGNPSSIHACGQQSRAAIEEARSKIAAFIGADSEEIVFTSSGTEANNFALKGTAWANRKKGNHIIISAIEHHASLESCKFLEKQGFDISYLPVDGFGMVNPESVIEELRPETVLVSVMHANNEVGTLQPVVEISAIARKAGVCFHSDAVQTLGQIPVDVGRLGVDFLSMSAHKLYGPKGVGALYIRKGTRISPLLHGGSQERGMRASTENLPGIVGFGAAVEIAESEMEQESRRLCQLRDRLIRGILDSIEGVRLNGHPVARLPNNVNVSIRCVEGEAVVLNLDFEGICASTGSACTSSSLEPSHVLSAMGLSHEMAHGSLRLSLGKWTTLAHIEHFLQVLPGTVSRLRAMSPLVITGKEAD